MFKVNRKATLASVAVAALFCLGSGLAAAPAFADDATPPTDPVVATVDSSTGGGSSSTDTQSADTQKPAPAADTSPAAPSPSGDQSPGDASPAAPVEHSDPAPAPAEAAPAPQPEAQPAPAPAPAIQQVAPQTTSTDVTTQGKPGKYQPVWCHLTGNDWKAQLGAKPSGGRNEAFPLMGDFGWGTTDDGQTLAHDRSSKLDAACEDQATPKPTEDASASVTAPQAVCMGQEQGQPTFTIKNATWGAIVDNGDGTFTRVATAVSGHAFPGGGLTMTVPWSNPAQIPLQSTNPYGQCYKAPDTVKVSIMNYAASQVCEMDSSNMFGSMNENGFDVTLTLSQGSKHANVVVPASGSVSLNDAWIQSNGFDYGTITVTASAPGATVVIAGDSTWNPVDPTVLLPTCPVENFGQFMVKTTQPTCTANGTATAYLDGVPDTETMIDLLDVDGNPIDALPQSVGAHSVRALGVQGQKFLVTTPAGPRTGISQISDAESYTILPALGYQSTDPEAPCYQAPELIKDAVATVTPPQAVCVGEDFGGTGFTIEHATWGEIVTNEDGSFSRTATADEGHAFPDGTPTATVNWSNPAKTPRQSTDSSKPCYDKSAGNGGETPGGTTPGGNTPGGNVPAGNTTGGSHNDTSNVEASGDRLATTGSDLPVGSIIGAALLLTLGSGLVLLRRRRAQSQQ